MEIEERELTNNEALNYRIGYNLVSNQIGSSEFNKNLGKVLSELDNISDQYKKSKKVVEDNLKSEYCEKYDFEEFPSIENEEEFNSLEKSVKKILRQYTNELSEKIKELFEESVGKVPLLILTQSDIEKEIKIGEKYKDKGFLVTPNFYRQLQDIIKE